VLTIPTSADIRAGLFAILKAAPDVQGWALQHGLDLSGTRFREWQPFAPFLDLGVLIDIDPVAESTPGLSCRSTFYETRFTLYVQYSGAASSLASEWLGVLESALDDASVKAVGVSGRTIFLRGVEFLSRGGQTRREEGWELPSTFRCKAVYA